MASAWVLEQERLILAKGVPLSDPQLSDAKLAGVAYPERVRLLRVEQIPFPEQPDLKSMVEAMKLTNPPTPGLALRYGIYLRSDFWGQRWQLLHELARTAQYERLGGVRAFLECYLYECLAIGPTAAPMEQEAITIAQRICGNPPSISLLPTPSPGVPTPKSARTRQRNSQTNQQGGGIPDPR
ncbi:MAG TPA: hypothetical protein VJW76_03285 [Verrucomicrobiae bacterium]|nr:hypothetical protein [Verrucomicrobiae bacterium]